MQPAQFVEKKTQNSIDKAGQYYFMSPKLSGR